MTTQLTTFIEHARSKGMDHATIRVVLLSAGWKERDIAQALTEQSLDMPVPLPPDTGGARDAFFHLLTFTAFFSVIISISVLLFQYINRLFPDSALDYMPYGDDLSGIRWSVAAVLVAFPLYVFLSNFLQKEMREHPEKSASGIRRWLTYLTLFVAAAALAGDVITFVFYLLEGGLSIRFVLKVLAVGVLAGGSFTYYFASLKWAPDSSKAKQLHRIFFGAATVVVIATLAWGIWLVGSPSSQRLRKFDERKVEQLRMIQQEIANTTARMTPNGEWELIEDLPETLEQVRDDAVYTRPQITDPQTGELYEYEILDTSHFRLCAEFNHERNEEFDVRWNHEAGRACFEFDVLDPQY